MAPRKGLGQKERTGFTVRGQGFSSYLWPGAHYAVILVPHLKSELTTHTSGSSRGTEVNTGRVAEGWPTRPFLCPLQPDDQVTPMGTRYHEEALTCRNRVTARVKSSHSERFPQDEQGALLPNSTGGATG